MKNSIKVFHWLPRIICILAILFVSVFALDAFSSELTIWQQLGAFVVHLIPSFLLLAFLILAWKREYVGGIIFIIIGLGMSLFVFVRNYKMNDSIWMSLGIILSITIPFIIVGVLFIVSHFLKKKNLLKTTPPGALLYLKSACLLV
jgi:cell division protein FtsW (lipid II flippase)